MDRPHPTVVFRSPPEAKIALFRALFRGRDDVYARRYESARTGRSGYAVACGNEWVRGVCEKPRLKCSTCTHQRFLPVTDAVVRRHLAGRDSDGRDGTLSLYPLLRDETCFFLALELDAPDWQDDARALGETCRRLELPAALERVANGRGGRLWFFFDRAIPATLARKLGAFVVTETMDQRPELGFDAYDRFIPRQDTLPRASLGTPIELPLQKRPRESGNSVFVNDDFAPYRDPWSHLASTQRLDAVTVEAVVAHAERRGRIVGVRMAGTDDADAESWFAERRPRQSPSKKKPPAEKIELIVSNQVYIPKKRLTPSLHTRLLQLAAFQNADFYRAQAMRLSVHGKPRVIGCARDYPRYLGLPRGCQQEARIVLEEANLETVVRDRRVGGQRIAVEFHGQLHPEQEAAALALLPHDLGVLAATTAFGKTVVAAWLIAQRGVNALVLVHRRQLVDQWVHRLAKFLDLPLTAIGRIGGGRSHATGSIDVALIQSLARNEKLRQLVNGYGHLVIDECHHIPAASFERIVRRAKARHVTGLSATVVRKDGRHPMILMQCGPVRHRVDARTQAARHPFTHTVHVRPTAFQSSLPVDADGRVPFHALSGELRADADRNRQIADDVLAAVRDGRSPLVLTQRNDHLAVLAAGLAGRIQHLVVLHGGMSAVQTAATAAWLAAIPEHESRVLLATGPYIGEGFDDARLDTLFLALPVSWRGTIAQYVGRLHRLHAGKREVRVYDYVDLAVPVLARMFDRRCRGYDALGYRILLPASAVPGWPVGVPLPIDPAWKSQSAASVARLVRDGVDQPLAELFVNVAVPIPAGVRGVDRARSASEAFLYRRLQTLPETSGRFALNALLPIPFDGEGQMEVDLLDMEVRLAIEIDGRQHLDDAEAYRRDRRKDALLQEHGYFVLRFLAEDLGKNLNAVLDAILRALVHRRSAILQTTPQVEGEDRSGDASS